MSSRHANYRTPRPDSSLRGDKKREIGQNYTPRRRPQNRRILKGARGIKQFVFITAGGAKRISIAAGKKGVRFGGTMKKSVGRFVRKAYGEWSYVSQNPGDRPARRNSTNPSLASAVAQSQAASMTSFFHPSGSVRDGTPLKINALTSVDELLYPYRVNPSQVALLIPPAPALAIFPSRYANGTVSRVHVRSRPFSRIYKQRSRLSVFQSCPSIPVRPVADPRLSTCSDVSSGVLGLVPLYEESGIGSLPLLQRPTISLSRTPDTIASNLPKSRKGKRMAEVISRVVQASPLQTPISKSRLIGRDLLATTNDPSGEEAGHNLEVIEKGKSWMRKSGHVSRGSGNPTPIQPEDSVEIVAARNLQRRRRRRRRRKQSKRKPYEEIISYSPEEQRSNSCDRVQTRQSDQVPSGSNNIADIKNVGVAMDEYYRSKGQKRIDRAGPIWEGPGHPPNISPSIKTITGFPQTSALLRDYRKPLPNSKAWVERI